MAVVAVASFSGAQSLVRCLRSLEVGAAGAEVIAAVAGGADLDAVAAAAPRARLIVAPPGTSVFRLRSLALAEAHADFVALLEDHCTVAPGWLPALLSAHAKGHAVVGGPVDHAGTGAYDWALYLSEYGPYQPPVIDGPVGALSAVNAGYDREALLTCQGAWSEAFYENEVHDALRARGFGLHLAAGAMVTTHLRMPPKAAAAHFFGGGRHFGRYRKTRQPALRRALLPLAAPLVPLVLLGRILGRVARRNPRRLPRSMVALPYLAWLVGAWSVGEAAGYLARVPPANTKARERQVR